MPNRWCQRHALLKVGDFQKKIGIIYRLKQICHFTILNSLFEVSRVFYSLAALLSINLETEKQNVISKLKFKIVFWHIFLSPIEFSEKKQPLEKSPKMRKNEPVLKFLLHVESFLMKEKSPKNAQK